ncbi:hypothetical protein GCM10010446_27750 [Streptomyces enissocaesilis]|uniref:Integral membrane protein n=1 Tax=Streptomyces enissocaesilis TaxID=332589 RepID=A0ABN3X946_9ACTN
MRRSEAHPQTHPGTRTGTGPRRRRPSRSRHEFEPGKLVTGLVLLGTAVAYAGDAGGLWHVPSYVALPALCLGLLVAGTAGWVAYGVRRRAARAASTEKNAAPPSTSGSQATR